MTSKETPSKIGIELAAVTAGSQIENVSDVRPPTSLTHSETSNPTEVTSQQLTSGVITSIRELRDRRRQSLADSRVAVYARQLNRRTGFKGLANQAPIRGVRKAGKTKRP